jgi:hypothetical protein
MIARMSKPKKQTSGKHKAARRHIALPSEWVDLADQLASDKRQLTSWYIIELLLNAAEEKKLPSPSPPWERKATD